MHQIRIHLAKSGLPIAGDDQHDEEQDGVDGRLLVGEQLVNGVVLLVTVADGEVLAQGCGDAFLMCGRHQSAAVQRFRGEVHLNGRDVLRLFEQRTQGGQRHKDIFLVESLLERDDPARLQHFAVQRGEGIEQRDFRGTRREPDLQRREESRAQAQFERQRAADHRTGPAGAVRQGEGTFGQIVLQAGNLLIFRVNAFGCGHTLPLAVAQVNLLFQRPAEGADASLGAQRYYGLRLRIEAPPVGRLNQQVGRVAVAERTDDRIKSIVDAEDDDERRTARSDAGRRNT